MARLRVAIDAGFRSQYFFDNWPLDVDPYLTSIRDNPKFNAMIEELRIDIDEMRIRILQAEATDDWEQFRSLAQTQPVNPAAISN